MAGEILAVSKEPLVELDHLGASLDRINRLVMPISEPVLRGVQYGEIQSLIRGQGSERDGMRDYIIGDDPRYIDWAASARSADGALKLRQHLKDITPSLWTVTDLAQRRGRVTPGQAYPEQTLAMSAALSMNLLAEKEQMPSGLFAVSDFQHFESDSAELGDDHILYIGRTLVNLTEAEPKADNGDRQHLGETLKRLGAVANESLIVIVSDFRDVASPAQVNGWKKPLQQLKHQGNDIIAIEINNPDQTSLARTERPIVSGGVIDKLHKSKKIDAEYARLAALNQDEIDAALKSVQAVHIKLSTDDKRWFSTLRAKLAQAAERASY